MSTTTTHTAGPWTIEPDTISVRVDGRVLQHHIIRNDDYLWLALVNDGELDNGIDNARLLVSAPAMLNALKGLYEHCVMVHKHWGEGSNLYEANAAVIAGEAAIAQAEGRTP